MEFESPDVEKEFPGLYASEPGRKSNESDFSDGGDHEKPSKKDLLIGRRKDKKEKKDKDKGYAALEGESSPEEDTETKSPSKSKKTKSFKFPSTSKSKEKREKSRDKEKCLDEAVRQRETTDKDKKKDKDKDKKEKDKKHKEKDKEKEEKAKFKLESKEKLKDKDKDKVKEKDKDKAKDKDKDKIKEKEKDKVKEKDKDKKDKKVNKVQTTVTTGIPFEEIFTLGVALPIFGVPLQASIERSRCHDDTSLPLVVRDSIDYLQEHGLKSTQIYRVDADKIKVQQLRKLYCDRVATYPYHWDVPVGCALLKAYISELPESVLTQELSYQFEQATAMAEPQREATVTALISKLPTANRTLLGWLMVHFENVLANEAVNHVNIQVLATVMGPALNMSINLLTYFVTKAQKLFPDVELAKYIPPLQSIPANFPSTADEIASELRKQESLLNQIHAEMHAGFVTPAREELLWEGQRIVTQLKRKLRSVQKSVEPNSLSMQQPSVDEKHEEEPAPIQQLEPPESQSNPSQPNLQPVQSSDSDTKAPSTEPSLPDTRKESPKIHIAEKTFEDNFQFSKETVTPSETIDTTDAVPSELEEEKPKLSEKELKLLKLQLENAEYLQLKSLLQAKINSEQFEIVKLRSQMAIKSKLENNSQVKESKELSPQEDLELKQKLVKDNAILEQKRLNLINQIFQERVACIQLKIELAMKEIM